jgi:hypothetical protein
VDVDPSEVPNPYNTSEGRAIRDHLLEEYKVKTTGEESVEELRARYRTAWNKAQEKRFMDGGTQTPDPRWMKAYEAEQELVQKSRLWARVEELGGTVDQSASVDALKAQVKALLVAKEKSEKERAEQEAKAKREAVSQEIERTAKVETKKGGQTFDEMARNYYKDMPEISMVPAKDNNEAVSDAEVVKRFVAGKSNPEMTKREKAGVENDANALVKWRAEIIGRRGTLISTSPIGIEVWQYINDSNDEEKKSVNLWILNLSAKVIALDGISALFIGTKRGQELTECLPVQVEATSWGSRAIGTYIHEEGVSPRSYFTVREYVAK